MLIFNNKIFYTFDILIDVLRSRQFSYLINNLSKTNKK